MNILIFGTLSDEDKERGKQLRESILANLEKRKMTLKDQKDTHEAIASGVRKKKEDPGSIVQDEPEK